MQISWAIVILGIASCRQDRMRFLLTASPYTIARHPKYAFGDEGTILAAIITRHMVHSDEKRLSDNKLESMEEKKNLPSHYAYHISTYKDKESGEEKTNWKRIGAAWGHKDGLGFYSRLDWFPKGGEIVFRPVPEEGELPEDGVGKEEFMTKIDKVIEESMPNDWQK